ncbi:MAG TPA: hypothetical protein VGC89_13780 [Pyrinomonadaceae bacterium]
MSEDRGETLEKRSATMSGAKWLLSLVAIALLSVGARAQTEGTIRRVNEEARAKMIEQMSAEARRFSLELNRNSLAFHNTDGALMIGMQVSGAEKAQASDLSKGADVAFVYVDSGRRASVPNGFYRVRIAGSSDARTQPATASKGRGLTASFINAEGRVVKQFPIGDGEGNSGGSPQGIYVQQGFGGGRWHTVAYFDSNYDMWAWMAGPYGP